nr:MAG TPA: hypothetical protein [Caudoviricetes sp.]
MCGKLLHTNNSQPMTTCISVLLRAASRHYALLFRGKFFKTRFACLNGARRTAKAVPYPILAE